LCYLAKFPGEVVLREDLIANVWPDVSATDDTLNNMIGKLRRILIADSLCQNYIVTIPKKGYCLKANVKEITSDLNLNNSNKLVIPPLTTVIIGILLYWFYFSILAPQSAVINFNQSYQIESVTSHQELEIFPALSPNSKHIAFIRVAEGLQENQLIIKELASGNERQLNDISGLYGNPVWSADGKKIAYIHMIASTCTVRMVDMLGGPSQFISDCSGELIRTMRKSLLWQHHTNSLVFSKASTNTSAVALFNYDLASKQVVKLSTPPANVIGDANPAVSVDGKLIAFTRTNESGVDNIIVLDLADNRETVYPVESQAVLGIDWLDDHSIIYVSDVNNRSELMVLNINNSEERFTRINGTGLLHPNFNNTTKHLTFSDLQSNANIVIKNRLSKNKAKLLTELQSSKFEREALFSPDGKYVIYIRVLENGAELWLYDLNQQQHKRLVKPENKLFRNISISPDSSRIALTVINNKTASIYIYDINKEHFFPLNTADIEKPLNPSWAKDSENILFSSKKDNQWLIWQSSTEITDLTLLTDQGGDVVVSDKKGENLYFSRQGKPGFWKLSFKDLSSVPTKLTDQITVPFQSWKFNDGIFYFLKRESTPSTHIYSYDPNIDKVSLYFQSSAAFNYFDIKNDLIVTAEIKEFTADVFLIKLK